MTIDRWFSRIPILLVPILIVGNFFFWKVWNGRTFVTLPKWKFGVPATLAVIPKNATSSPLLQPYPNWNWHVEGNCNGLTSVFRISVSSGFAAHHTNQTTKDILPPVDRSLRPIVGSRLWSNRRP